MKFTVTTTPPPTRIVKLGTLAVGDGFVYASVIGATQQLLKDYRKGIVLEPRADGRIKVVCIDSNGKCEVCTPEATDNVLKAESVEISMNFVE